MSLVPLSPYMLCLAYILSSSQLEQRGDYEAPWEVDLGGRGLRDEGKRYLSGYPNLLTSRKRHGRGCLLCLCAQVSFLFLHKCSLWHWGGEALTTGKVKGPAGHRCAAAGVAESAGLLTRQGSSSAESNQQCFCWIRGSVDSLGFIPVTPLLYWLYEKEHSDLFCLVRSLGRMRTQKRLSSCCFTWLVSAMVTCL